jgi:hypothetical protein
MDQGENVRVYIGRVLRDLDGQPIQYDFRQPTAGDTRGDIDNDGTPDIEGTVTLWIRRPLVGDRDSESNDRAILTAEGIAPSSEFTEGTGRNGSLRRLEMTVSLAATSSIAGDRYSDVTKGSEATGDELTDGWVTVDRIQ